MPSLATSEHVIARSGVERLPQYVDILLITDVPGFAVKRNYPAGSDLSNVLNHAGQQVIRCIVQFIVEPPTSPHGVSSVTLRAWTFPRWRERHLLRSATELPAGDPDAPTPDSLQRWRRARKPHEVDFVGDFLYDAAEDRFLDADGRNVTTEYMLDYVYEAHCRTLRARFIWRWSAGSFARWVARSVVWRGQDGCLWLLLNLYDFEVTTPKEVRSPFHQYRRSHFGRTTEAAGERSTFFGFQSSRKSLFTNLVVLAIACIALYRYGPRGGLLTAIYRSDALTTAALVLGFFVADLFGPAVLIRAICLLSRLRPAVMFLVRKVRP